MKHLHFALILVAGCASIAGCNGTGNDEAPGAATADATDPAQHGIASSALPAEAVANKDAPIWFEPASASSCPGAAPITGVVHWNASSFPGVTTVQVTLSAGEGQPEGMFAISATTGQKDTGPWLVAGTEMVLRDNANGTELARAKMPGAPCVQ